MPTPHTGLHELPSADYPLVLSTGRIKDQWHTMTRTGRSAKLMRDLDGPFVEMHPEAARRVGAEDGERVRVVSARGSFVARVVVTESVEPGTVFAPFHWGDLWTNGGSVNDATHDVADPVSGQPELKGAAVRVEPIHRGVESRSLEARRASGGGRMSERLRVVVVGNGIAGAAFVDELLEEDPDRVSITLYGAEKVGTYNRVRLSEYMAGAVGLEELGMRPKAWYEERGIDVRLGVRVLEVDTKEREVLGSDGERVAYDRLVFATGSESFVPPIPGRDKEGGFVFRTVEDVERMLEAAPKRAVVIGGGLLGLEAAWGLVARGAEVTVVDLAGHLMSQQLDRVAGGMLRREIEKMGVGVRLSAFTEEILGNGKVEGVRLRGGEELPADTVVICAGIRPNAELARASGIKTNRGVIVDDRLETSAPGVYAVGECAEHDGAVYGLVAPALEQVRVAARYVLGKECAPYRGSVASATLKVMGVDVTSAGDVYEEEEGSEAIVSSDPLKGVYRKAVIQNGRVVGAILLGDVSGAPQLIGAVRRTAPAEEVVELTLGSGGGFDAPPLSDDAQVCDCNGVSKGQVVVAITKKGASSVSAVGAATKAGTGCGSCKPLVKQILEEVSGGPVEEEKNYLCKCMELSREDIRGILRERGIKSVSGLSEACGAGKMCPDCKVGLAYVVSEVNANRHEEERHARHINDRVHANIQNDGTFSVVPRIHGGVTSPDQLRRIADVAEKYNARKEDLPRAWEDLGMPSGFAYTKAVRTVKTCVGTDFCRYGVGDSTGLGIAMEKAFENLYTPAKVKMGCSGCPRNCAEATVKDIGVVAVEGGWKIYVAGAAGMSVRAADELAQVETPEEVMKVTSAFLQYYRENAEYKERTYDFVPRIGLEKIRSIVLDEESGEPERLRQRLREAKEAAFDPWKERTKPRTKNQFAGVISGG
jgi:nitrite reductase (NADH) large subunit